MCFKNLSVKNIHLLPKSRREWTREGEVTNAVAGYGAGLCDVTVNRGRKKIWQDGKGVRGGEPEGSVQTEAEQKARGMAGSITTQDSGIVKRSQHGQARGHTSMADTRVTPPLNFQPCVHCTPPFSQTFTHSACSHTDTIKLSFTLRLGVCVWSTVNLMRVVNWRSLGKDSLQTKTNAPSHSSTDMDMSARV